MKKLNEISHLIDAYKNVITKTQYECLDLFYFCDLSLAEIAEVKKTTRAAIFNNINRAVKKLIDLEEKLKIVAKSEKRMKIYNKINDKELLEKLIEIEKD